MCKSLKSSIQSSFSLGSLSSPRRSGGNANLPCCRISVGTSEKGIPSTVNPLGTASDLYSLGTDHQLVNNDLVHKDKWIDDSEKSKEFRTQNEVVYSAQY